MTNNFGKLYLVPNLLGATKPEQVIPAGTLNIVCEYFKISPEQMALNTRKRQVVQARQIAMYLSKKYSNASLASIGQQCGKKDHATVHHACKTIANQLETDKQFKVMFADIEKKIALS